MLKGPPPVPVLPPVEDPAVPVPPPEVVVVEDELPPVPDPPVLMVRSDVPLQAARVTNKNADARRGEREKVIEVSWGESMCVARARAVPRRTSRAGAQWHPEIPQCCDGARGGR